MATSVFSTETNGSGRAMAEINITPLVDVMLVLLIIFMVTAPLLTRTLDVGLPQSGGAPAARDRVELLVEADGTFRLDGVLLDLRGLETQLAAIAGTSPNAVLEISANGEADYQAFASALSVARGSGLGHIALNSQ